MLDAVITYVDSRDSKWRKDYEKFVKRPLEEVENRFRSYDCLDLQIKLIRKNMSFVENIFVIVSSESQVPKNIKELENVYIVTHKDIIPKRYLPCFNSCTIEMYMYNIKDLKEHFIYFNDDVFVVSKCKETDFIEDGKIVANFDLKDYSIETANSFEMNIINSNRIINKFVSVYVKPAHFCFCLNKSHIEEIWIRHKNEIEKSLTRTRHKMNINFYAFVYYEIYINNYVSKENKTKYFSTLDNLKDIYDCVKENETKVICINDNYNYDFAQWKEKFKEILEYALDRRKTVKFEEEKPIVLDNTPLKVALCAIAKNENLYIREWVEWYKNLGISKIFLYDNNELDGERFEEVINDYIESGFVEVIDRRGIEKGCIYDEDGINLQPKCYIEFYEGEGKNYDWICFFDIDEFLTFKEDYNLFNFLNQEMFNDTDTILVSWEHYDDNNLYDYDKRPVIKRFTNKSKIGFHGVKSIVRPNKKIENKAQENLIHCFKLKNHNIRFVNGIKAPEINSHNFYKLPNDIHNKCNVVLNHYKTKTISEYLYRHLGRHWGTGRKNTDNIKGITNCYNDFFLYNQKTELKENIIKTFVKNNEVIQYYKKINSLNLIAFIKKYNEYIDSLSLNENLSSKEYNKELGIITITSWKARINDVYITLCNLLDMCPNFHIVLVLSEEEFPNKENELPISLKKLVSNKLIEILWTENNYKTCKKLIFTIEKYFSKGVPIITADDDCLYITNYAQELYNRYKEKNNYVIRYNMYNIKETWQYSQGPCTLYNPIIFKYFLQNKDKFLDSKMLYKDDQIITKICKENKIIISHLYRGHIFPFVFINEYAATNDNTKNIDFINCYV